MYLRERTAARLSPPQAKMLLAYIDGPKQIVFGGYARVTMRTLIKRQLLVPCTKKGQACRSASFPRFARLTDFGREIVAYLLAIEADALAALGCADPAAPPLTLAPDHPKGDDDDEARVHDESCGVRDVPAVA